MRSSAAGTELTSETWILSAVEAGFGWTRSIVGLSDGVRESVTGENGVESPPRPRESSVTIPAGPYTP